eukprot:TRINITY_DN38753_c0_g1_i1.p1 TRINITY_DN38753_c0_g1~~TRINITY_DN38753_c0_g1_i1.p1  ORF type:complete len:597 (+),score=117.36 TRINITY_DN38753_c0_g1_i1:117-1793(+)
MLSPPHEKSDKCFWIPRAGGDIEPTPLEAELDACVTRHRRELEELFSRAILGPWTEGLPQQEEGIRGLGDEAAPRGKLEDGKLEAKLPHGGSEGMIHCNSKITEMKLDPAQLEQRPIPRRWTISDEADMLRAESGHGDPDDETRAKAVPPHAASISDLIHNYPMHVWFAAVVRWKSFDSFFASVIVLNSVLVGITVQYAAVNQTYDAPAVFAVFQVLFVVLFGTELFFRVGAQGKEFFRVVDWGWNVFDTVSVFASVVELFFVWFGGGSAALLVIRIIRVLRIVRIIRVVRFLRELRMIVITIMQTMKSLFWSMLAMGIVLYMFAIVFTQAAVDHVLTAVDADPADIDDILDDWGNLQNSLYSLFLAVTGGRSWYEVADSLLLMSPLYFNQMIFFICFMEFCMMNVITGFFCEQAFDMAQADKDQLVQEQLADKKKYIAFFEQIWHTLDTDNSGMLRLGEMTTVMEDERVQAYLAHLNINVQCAWEIFRLLDADGGGSVSIDEFVTGLLKLRGEARTIDIRSIAFDLNKMAKVLSEFMSYVDHNLIEIQEHMKRPGAC